METRFPFFRQSRAVDDLKKKTEGNEETEKFL
jgi:hypothetical protein